MSERSYGEPDAQSRARQALVEAASDPSIRADFPTMSKCCDAKVLKELVDLAWRHQFTDDRYGFKRDLQELQRYVAARARSKEDEK